MYRILSLLLFFGVSPAYSQEGGMPMTDKTGFYEYQRCLESNTAEIYSTSKVVGPVTSHQDDDYLLQTYDLFKPAVMEVVEKSINEANKYIDKIEKHSDHIELITSLRLEAFFTAIFERNLSALFSMEKCIGNGTFGYFDYFSQLEKMFSRISHFETALYGSEGKQTRYRYYGYDYLLRMAVLKYQPNLDKYVNDQLLIKKKEFIENNDIDFYGEYVWGLFDGIYQ